MKPFELHPEAKAEFDDEVAYYETRQAGLGRRFRTAVVAALRRMRKSPGVFPLEAGTTCRRVRVDRFPFRPVFFDADVIRVVAVHHDRRQPGYWLHRLPPP